MGAPCAGRCEEISPLKTGFLTSKNRITGADTITYKENEGVIEKPSVILRPSQVFAPAARAQSRSFPRAHFAASAIAGPSLAANFSN